MPVACYDSYAFIPCTWYPSHILWKVRSPMYISSVQCPILYCHDSSCRPSDVLYHIIMAWCVESCTWMQKVSCQQGIKKLFVILRPPVRYFFVVVASCRLYLAIEQRYAILVLFVLLLIDGRVSKASRHWVNEFFFKLTNHAVISRSVACDRILKAHQELCASILVIVDRRDGEAWSHLHGIRSCDLSDARFCRMKRTHPEVACGPSVVMDGVLVSSCAYIATNSTSVWSAG